MMLSRPWPWPRRLTIVLLLFYAAIECFLPCRAFLLPITDGLPSRRSSSSSCGWKRRVVVVVTAVLGSHDDGDKKKKWARKKRRHLSSSVHRRHQGPSSRHSRKTTEFGRFESLNQQEVDAWIDQQLLLLRRRKVEESSHVGDGHPIENTTTTTIQQRQDADQKDEDSATTATAALVASTTAREETEFVRFLGQVQSQKILQYVLQLVQFPTVYLYTAALTALRQQQQQSSTTSSNHPHQHIVIGRNDDFDDDDIVLMKQHRRQQEACLEILDAMDEHQIPPSSYTICELFRTYCFAPNDAWELRSFLLDRYPDLVWNEFMWEAAIYACAQRCDDDDAEAAWTIAMTFYEELRRENSLDHDVTGKRRRHPMPERIYVALLTICAVNQDVEHATSLLENELLPKILMTPRLWGAVLKVCAAAGDHEQARLFLERMSTFYADTAPPNIRHCSWYLRALVVAQEMELAAAFLDHMMAFGYGDRSSSSSSSIGGIINENPSRASKFSGIRVPAPDMLAIKTVLRGCGECGAYRVARKLLENIKEGHFGPSIQKDLDEESYNLVLASCDDPFEAKALVREMRLSRRHRVGVIPPSKITFTKAIAVCRKAGDLESARFFLDGARNDGIKADVFMYTAAIWTAAQASNKEAALKLFEEMKGDNILPTIVSYNGIFAALSSCSEADSSLFHFHEMRTDYKNLTPDLTTFYHLAGAIRKVQSDEERLALLWRLYGAMGSRERRVKVGGPVLEAIITTYGKLDHFAEAMSVFEAIEGPSDAGCLRAILLACSLADPPQWETALSLLHTSDIVEGVSGPALVESGALCNTMLACSKAGEWEESLQLLRLYGNETASIVAVNSLITACGRGGRADMAVSVLNEMGDYGIRPNERSYRNAVIACNQAEHDKWRVHGRTKDSNDGFEWWECAISLLRRMADDGLRPDTATLSSAISACEAAGKWQTALEILQSAMSEGMADPDNASDNGLNLYCFNAAIAACEKGSAWVEALEIYERLKAQGNKELRPNVVTLSSLVLALDKAGQKELAVSMYEEGLAKRFAKSPWRETVDSFSGEKISAIDLHSFSAAMARAAMRSHFGTLLSTELSSKNFDIADDLIIIVGKGLRSEEVPVLKETVQCLLRDEFGLDANVDSQNYGRLVVQSRQLQSLVETRRWR